MLKIIILIVIILVIFYMMTGFVENSSLKESYQHEKIPSMKGVTGHREGDNFLDADSRRAYYTTYYPARFTELYNYYDYYPYNLYDYYPEVAYNYETHINYPTGKKTADDFVILKKQMRVDGGFDGLIKN